MKIRPCIDIHDGKVKQIIGGSLNDQGASATENYVSGKPASYYATLYQELGLPGGHIILLNSMQGQPELYALDREQAKQALQSYPGGMQVGGGITPQNAEEFLSAGASHVIVTSYCFRDGNLDEKRLAKMTSCVGKEHLVLDVSCKFNADQKGYVVVTDRWQKETSLVLTPALLKDLSASCDEFLVHAADAEGKQAGIETGVASLLGEYVKTVAHPNPVTYAGGIHSLADVDTIRTLSNGLVDATVGSALDLFGGDLHLEDLRKACE